MDDKIQIKSQLESKKMELEKRLAMLKQQKTYTPNQSSKERAMEIKEEDIATGLEKESQQELNAINRCIKMIESGEYGVCIDCGEEIPLKRLMAIPYTEFCIRCCQDRERRIA